MLQCFRNDIKPENQEGAFNEEGAEVPTDARASARPLWEKSAAKKWLRCRADVFDRAAHGAHMGVRCA